jgi:hypothetical protein
MRLRSSFTFLLLAAYAVACNAILDLGRFTEGPTDSGGGVTGSNDSGIPSNLACVTAPKESLAPGPVNLQLIIATTIGEMETPGQIDGGTDITYAAFTPQPGVTIEACQSLDPTCGSPVTTPQVVDDAGIADLTFSGNFVGFFRGTSPITVPFTFWPGNWLSGATSASYGTSALQYTQESALNVSLNNAVILDAGAGLGELFMVVFDCNDHRFSGATLAITGSGPDTLPFYVISNLPSTTAEATDSFGVAGAVNVPHGPVRATATDLATGTTIGSIDVYINSGELTLGWIRPRTH